MSSLTFGPKWVRDLSSGDNGVAAPPNTPPPRKYKLAEFRYGREEMLALLSDEYDFPLGLKEFEDIINKRPVQPLAFVPVSEEEERCQMGGVNSALVLKMTGRGVPGLRGRGGMRGRGRGRGNDYTLHRSSSSSEETNFPPRSWPEGHQRTSYHRPIGRGESADTSRSYDSSSRFRLSSDSGYHAPRPGEYWRTNSNDHGDPSGQDNDGWRTTTKSWNGKKGFSDNNRNWREGLYDKGSGNDHQLMRSKSWSRSSTNESSGKTHDPDLPEWCNNDSFDDNTPGSFDSSGQFRISKEQEKSAPDNDESTKEKDAERKEVSEQETPEPPPNLVSKQSLKIKPEVVAKQKDDIQVDQNPYDETNKEEMKTEMTVEGATKKTSVPQKPATLEPTPALETCPEDNEKKGEDDDVFSLENMKDMVAKLDEDDLPPVHDPSIVFAKKAEPGKVINGMQDWIYRDPQGEVQGPFSNDEMHEWYKAGYFTVGLLVRRVCDEMFLPLGDVIKLWGRIPFAHKNQPAPITSQMLIQHQQQQNQLHRLMQQQLQQQQKQQQMRQTLLKQMQVDDRPQDLGLPSESVWGDTSNKTTPNSVASPWTPISENSSWKNSPTDTHVLKATEAKQQQRQLEFEKRKRSMESSVPVIGSLSVTPTNEDAEQQDAVMNDENGNPQNKADTPTKKKNNTKENNDNDNEEDVNTLQHDQKQKDKEEAHRKALEALKHRHQLQQQQKLAEQQRLVDEQTRREEEIRNKQHQLQMHQQMLLQKYQQEQQRKQQAPTWQMAQTSSAPSLAEIQRAQERKEAELHEHMKTIHQHEQMVQQQRAQARWAQQQGFRMQQQQAHRPVKSLLEIQEEQAKKLQQLQQQQQQRHQQSSQHFNHLPWNAAGQPINKSTKKDAMFWDDVMGIPPSRANGVTLDLRNQQQQQKKAYNDFPVVSNGNKSSKRDNKEQEIVNRIFQSQTPSTDFINWVERNLPAVKKAIDVPTVVGFLQDIDSPYEIHDYMRSYLGDSNEQKEFVREFLERRKKSAGQQQQQQRSPSSSIPSKVTTPETEECNDADTKRNKKKKKMQKFDPNLLGFQCNAAPEVLNRAGEIQSVADVVGKK